MENLAEALDLRLVALWHVIGRVDRDLSRTAASVLATLRDNGPQRITALADAEAVAQPSMTTLVARLERDGLVAARARPDDARAVLVHLTDEGLERLTRSAPPAPPPSRRGSRSWTRRSAPHSTRRSPCWTS